MNNGRCRICGGPGLCGFRHVKNLLGNAVEWGFTPANDPFRGRSLRISNHRWRGCRGLTLGLSVKWRCKRCCCWQYYGNSGRYRSNTCVAPVLAALLQKNVLSCVLWLSSHDASRQGRGDVLSPFVASIGRPRVPNTSAILVVDSISKHPW